MTVSDPLQRIMEQVYPDLQHKLTTIYDIRNQALIKKMALEFDPYYPKADVPILTTVGRMVPQKGYDLAVEACKILKDRGYSFKWYLVGDGPERSRILSLISEKNLDTCLFSVGAKENPYPYIKHADIYVQTSRFEGFCLTLCEARILCIPPVSTNFEVVYDQLQDGKNGLIVNMTPPAIADGIEKLLSDTALRQSISITLSCEKNGNEEEISKLYSLIEGII